MANYGLLNIQVYQADGSGVKLGWHSRSAIHRELKAAEKDGRLKNPIFYVAYSQSAIAGVGHKCGNGWSSSL